MDGENDFVLGFVHCTHVARIVIAIDASRRRFGASSLSEGVTGAPISYAASLNREVPLRVVDKIDRCVENLFDRSS